MNFPSTKFWNPAPILAKPRQVAIEAIETIERVMEPLSISERHIILSKFIADLPERGVCK
jgi:hypothetical protein